MTARVAAALALLAVLAAPPARAAPATIAIADFDYLDSSGEARDQAASHAARLAAFKAGILDRLGKSANFTAVALQCPSAPCSADRLDQVAMIAAARSGHARFVAFGAIHKVSSLIQFGQIAVMRVSDGRAVLARTISFRGDSEDAWQHATGFTGDMLVSDIAAEPDGD